MDALKALKDKLKQEKGLLVQSDKKYVKKGEVEAAKLLKLRQEEEEERKRKELKRKADEKEDLQAASKAAKPDKDAAHEQLLPNLPREEVIRRLRALSQPATLFGEEDVDRLKRLLKAEKEVHVDDDKRGGQQDNVLLELQRQKKAKKDPAGGAGGGGKAGGDDQGANKADGAGGRKTEGKVAAPAAAPPGGPDAKDGAGGGDEPGDETMEAFERAAAMLAEKRAEEALSIEERIAKWIRRWMKEWEADLDKRPAAVKATNAGYQADMMFGQTKKYLEPLYVRLRQKALHEEMRAGLWMMVQAMRDRNYLHANDIYLRLAIGNAPWPIGVTSVGIHERSAREKISHVMNASGQAHIMNDEATRKFLQAVKRLIGAVQRLYPTVPSRSVDFETTADPGRGMSGAGSTKLALLQAEAQGQTTQALGLPDAPHFLDANGRVMVPPKWQHILAKAQESMGGEGKGREGSPVPTSKSPAPTGLGSPGGASKQPPRSPAP